MKMLSWRAVALLSSERANQPTPTIQTLFHLQIEVIHTVAVHAAHHRQMR
jgi:hypothetical protein